LIIPTNSPHQKLVNNQDYSDTFLENYTTIMEYGVPALEQNESVFMVFHNLYFFVYIYGRNFMSSKRCICLLLLLLLLLPPLLILLLLLQVMKY